MKYLLIEDWAGGLSEGEKKGQIGSFRFGQGLDYSSNPDAITAELALVKDSGAIVVDLVSHIDYDSIQNDLFCLGDAGNIYKKDDLTTWSLLQATANCDGEGLAVFNDYLYYAQNAQLGRYGVLSGVPGFDDDWKKAADDFTVGGPLKTFQNQLLAGNGRYLATVDDAGVFDAQRLTFPPGWHVHDIEVRGEYAAIAVNNNSNSALATRGIVFYWDGTSHAYNYFREIMDGGGVTAIQGNQDSLWIFPVSSGNIYLDTSQNTKVKKIPFVGLGKSVRVYPGSNANFGGMLVFGTAGGTSTTVYKGVYKYGRPDKDLPLSLNFAYPQSHGVVHGATVLTGAIFTLGTQIYVGWRNAATYGVDLLSTSTLQSSVVYESRRKSFGSRAKIQRLKVYHNPLATGESITIKYKADKEAAWVAFDAVISYSASDAETSHLLNKEFSATDVEFQMTLAGTGTTIPTVHKIIAEYDEEAGL